MRQGNTREKRDEGRIVRDGNEKRTKWETEIQEEKKDHERGAGFSLALFEDRDSLSVSPDRETTCVCLVAWIRREAGNEREKILVRDARRERDKRKRVEGKTRPGTSCSPSSLLLQVMMQERERVGLEVWGWLLSQSSSWLQEWSSCRVNYQRLERERQRSICYGQVLSGGFSLVSLAKQQEFLWRSSSSWVTCTWKKSISSSVSLVMRLSWHLLNSCVR